VATIDNSLISIKSPVVIGLFCSLLLYGCQATTPEEVTTKFWQALAQGQIAVAQQQATHDTQHLVKLNDVDQRSTITTGQVAVNDQNAMVETTISRNNKPVTFNTVLLKEQDSWKVDFQQTHTNIAMLPFDGLVKGLQDIGDTFAKELEQAVPLIEKEMESFGNELKKQLDEFGRTLKKPQDPNKPKSPPNTI
jgi:hypothetical protein